MMRAAKFMLISFISILFLSFIVNPSYAPLIAEGYSLRFLVSVISLYIITAGIIFQSILSSSKLDGTISFSLPLHHHALMIVASFANTYIVSFPLVSSALSRVAVFFGTYFSLFCLILSLNRFRVRDRYQSALLLVALIYVVSHLQFMSEPLMAAYTDEGWHVGQPLRLAQFYFQHDTIPRTFEHLKLHVWYEPLSYILNLLPLLVFGMDIFGFRATQLLFAIFTSAYVYRTSLLYRDRETSLISAVLFLLFPTTFFFSGRAMLESVSTFLTVLSVFHFTRWNKDGTKSDLMYSAMAAASAVLYKKPSVLLFTALFLYILIFKRRRLFEFSLNFILPFFLLTGPLFYILGQIGRFGGGGGSILVDLVSPLSPPWDAMLYGPPAFSRMTYYLEALPYMLTPIFAALFFIALFRRDKDPIDRISAIWFAAWYGFFTVFIAQEGRFIFQTLPAVALIIAPALAAVFASFNPRSKKTLFWISVVLMTANSLHVAYHAVPSPVSYVGIGDASVAYVTLPFEEATLFLKSEGAKRVGGFWKSYTWYAVKHGFGADRVDIGGLEFSDVQEMHSYFKSEGTDYLLLTPNDRFIAFGASPLFREHGEDMALRPDLFKITSFKYKDRDFNTLVVVKIL